VTNAEGMKVSLKLAVNKYEKLRKLIWFKSENNTEKLVKKYQELHDARSAILIIISLEIEEDRTLIEHIVESKEPYYEYAFRREQTEGIER